MHSHAVEQRVEWCVLLMMRFSPCCVLLHTAPLTTSTRIPPPPSFCSDFALPPSPGCTPSTCTATLTSLSSSCCMVRSPITRPQSPAPAPCPPPHTARSPPPTFPHRSVAVFSLPGAPPAVVLLDGALELAVWNSHELLPLHAVSGVQRCARFPSDVDPVASSVARRSIHTRAPEGRLMGGH